MHDLIVELLNDGFITAMAVLAAPLLTALVAAMVMAALQAITSMHDATLALAPRLIAMTAVLALLSPWILAKLVSFTVAMLQASGGIRPSG